MAIDDGLHIEDEKSGEVEILSLDELKIFKDRIITIKKDIENEEVEEDDEKEE